MRGIAVSASLLMAALQGIAEAEGLSQIVGVCASNHPSHNAEKAESLDQAYDQFFAALGAEAPSDGFFRLAVPLRQKPLSEIGRHHRGRTKVKRQMKQTVAAEAGAAWRKLARPPAEEVGVPAEWRRARR